MRSFLLAAGNYEVFYNFTSDKYIDFYAVNLERCIKRTQRNQLNALMERKMSMNKTFSMKNGLCIQLGKI